MLQEKGTMGRRMLSHAEHYFRVFSLLLRVLPLSTFTAALAPTLARQRRDLRTASVTLPLWGRQLFTRTNFATLQRTARRRRRQGPTDATSHHRGPTDVPPPAPRHSAGGQLVCGHIRPSSHWGTTARIPLRFNSWRGGW